MYSNWSPTSGQGQTPYAYYSHDQRRSEYQGQADPYAVQSHLSDSYGFNAMQFPQVQQLQASTQRPYSPPDPRFMVQQTNQALTALASARRLYPEYSQDHRTVAQTMNTYPHFSSRYEPHQSSHLGNPGSKSSSEVQLQPTQIMTAGLLAPTTSVIPHKPAEGHACSYCGKAFGRPSALKVRNTTSFGRGEG
ncbi:hypothetical protein H0H92_006688 [Tricholoma furcatifolium]|nr:hypothetical protein H0H92_006688 [Tricholoma furcatifolium]